jgi:flagellar motility protein MotE (MotC chaperone)
MLSSMFVVLHFCLWMSELSKLRDAARKGAKRPLTAPSAEKHAETIKSLDNERLALVKEIRERESELAHMDEDFRKIRDDVITLEETSEADEHPLDGAA